MQDKCLLLMNLVIDCIVSSINPDQIAPWKLPLDYWLVGIRDPVYLGASADADLGHSKFIG